MAVSGKTGSVTVGGSTYCAKNWSVDIATDRLDSTSFCSGGWREYIEGLKGVTGSVGSDVRLPTSGSVVLKNDLMTITGSAMINESATTDVAELVNFTYDIQFSGSVAVA